jgi:hypothetical protein
LLSGRNQDLEYIAFQREGKENPRASNQLPEPEPARVEALRAVVV